MLGCDCPVWRTVTNEKWTFKFRDDQVRLLQIVLQFAEASHTFDDFNRNWMPVKVLRMQITELLKELNEVMPLNPNDVLPLQIQIGK